LTRGAQSKGELVYEGTRQECHARKGDLKVEQKRKRIANSTTKEELCETPPLGGEGGAELGRKVRPRKGLALGVERDSGGVSIRSHPSNYLRTDP